MTEPSDAEALLGFFFGDAVTDPERAGRCMERWFGVDPRFDAALRERFRGLLDAAAQGRLDAWRASPRSGLALVIALDQLPRNLFRGRAEAFAHDDAALAAARDALARGHLDPLAPLERGFLLLPFQHAESVPVQREGVTLYERVVDEAPPSWKPLLESFLDYSRQHLEIVLRFGRFPHRNGALGRSSTPEERAYLEAGGATFGQGSGEGPAVAS